MHPAIIDLRHQLHRHPELSGAEAGTAARVRGFMQALVPDALIEGLGGHGLACVFTGAKPGPTVLLRCELDALPITEVGERSHRSVTHGVGHQCGHDGHMAILAAVATELARQRPPRGRVVLLFQPAEETGEGAAAVVADPKFAAILPDYCFALHNVPGYPLGHVLLREGPFSCASRGMAITLSGCTAHAAQPETGRSPAAALCRIVSGLSTLPTEVAEPGELTFATVVGARLGEKAFGTAPGQAAIWATLRSQSNEGMRRLIDHAEQLARSAADADGLQLAIEYADIFPATLNDPAAAELIRAASAGMTLHELPQPFRWSEDFGHFTARCRGAMFGIGAGQTSPDLHNADYDFPDSLIPIASGLFLRIIDRCLQSNAGGTPAILAQPSPSTP